MAYTRNIPPANQFQSVSQPIIRDNFNSCDDTFNLDHYGFSDTTPNIGLHRQVTTPDRGSHPSSPLSIPVMYAKNESGTQLGILQYSKGPDRSGNQVSSPLTYIQSQETAITISNGGSTTIFDFTGITRCFCHVIVGNFSSSPGYFINSADLFWTSTGPRIKLIPLNGTSNNLVFNSSSNSLIVQNATGNTLNDVYWTLQFWRIQI